MKDLKIRSLSGVIGIALLIWVLKTGGNTLALFILALSLIGLYEFYRALSNIGYRPINLIGYLGTIGIFLSKIYFNIISLEFIMIILVILLLGIYLFQSESKVDINDIGVTLLGILYIPLSLFHIYLLDGSNLIWLVFIIPFGSDTFAYFAGNLLGKRKLSPNISPNKSVEGSIGGIIGSAVLASAYNYKFLGESTWKFIVIGALGSIVSQIGDLVASKIKRSCKIKDYGKLIPGHGGVMDRFDSVIFSGPLIYYALIYII